MGPVVNVEELIKEYKNGASMNSLAQAFGTYPTTIKRILERSGVELRHDTIRKGTLAVKDGEKLIEWAKAQGRLVTKSELANVLGKTRLSPSYFIKYPELGQYVTTREQNDIKKYSQKLYNWLQKNNITYKPNDRTNLGVSVSALLLGEYSGLAIDIFIKPKCVSKKMQENKTKLKMCRAKTNGIVILFLNEEHFENLDCIKGLLDSLKKES